IPSNCPPVKIINLSFFLEVDCKDESITTIVYQYRGFILTLTFLFYTAYHLSRKPISIVKSELHRNCSLVIRPADLNFTNNATWCDWAPFDQNNYQTLFGVLDNSFLVAYAIGMFFSGIFGERVPLRYYLSFGMLMSGVFTCLFGLGFYLNIHSLWYYSVIQVLNGLMQTTGWPAVVACIGNWFGKGKRGFIMGVWNSHTSVGNILGSLIAGAFVSSAWGLSFIVPGLIIASTGILCFFFLVESKFLFSCDGDETESVTNNSSHVDRVAYGSISAEPAEAVEQHTEAISFSGALSIPGVVEFSLCLLFAKLVSYTFLYWLPLYISNVAHFDAKAAGDMSTLFDVGGIVGGITAGLVSDYTGGRATTCCVMLLTAAPMLFLYNYIGQRSLATTVGMLLLCGGLVNGPYALITTAVSADLGTHESLRGNSRALSTVTAIIDGTGSVGAAVGPLLAGLISPTGWNHVFYMLITSDLLACLFLSRLVYKEALGWCRRVPRARGFKEI
uniref:Glucose-6-phosphate exchanger SLC37A2 n=1 Tax=Gasterosteus aculeatus aculeatus TaxID=481459 RepID=G3Q0N1_GASAC